LTKKHEGCVATAAGPITAAGGEKTGTGIAASEERREIVKAQVGKQAPDFEATAYVGEGFKNIKLSDFKGRWVTLCFYPGDFTFV
jgi:hypothetical protein